LALGVRTEKARLERAQVGAALGTGGVQGANRAIHEVVQILTAQVDESAWIAEGDSGPFQAQAQRARLGMQGATQSSPEKVQLGQQFRCHRNGQLGRC
jgi:hypothetical protein